MPHEVGNQPLGGLIILGFLVQVIRVLSFRHTEQVSERALDGARIPAVGNQCHLHIEVAFQSRFQKAISQ
ncbi:hypothetical protein D3C80_2106620 [compost metagenome]